MWEITAHFLKLQAGMGWLMMYLELTNIRADTNLNTIVFIRDEIITIEILYVNSS